MIDGRIGLIYSISIIIKNHFFLKLHIKGKIEEIDLDFRDKAI
jgi:hypothetical protein